MSRIYVDVYTPGNGNTYEFQLDDRLSVCDCTAQMIAEIRELENNSIPLEAGRTVLFHSASRLPLADGDTLRGANVRSGARLLLL